MIVRLVVFFLLLGSNAAAQKDSGSIDSPVVSGSLGEVMVTAYSQHSTLLNAAAPLNIIDNAALLLYSNTSILPAVNATPGVQMDERSPASYRLAIRGSSLRSPFGVRNVKVYYNGIPFTDPGGTTYLNNLGLYNFNSLEIIKGPGSSLYGAGTGGVLLINSLAKDWRAGANISAESGSYGLLNVAAELNTGRDSFQNAIRLQHLSSDGYRVQSRSRRDVGSWDTRCITRRGAEIGLHVLYSDLYYETPGALTQKEFDADPRAARPHTGSIQSAQEAQAAIYQKMALAGLTYRQILSSAWHIDALLYGAYLSQINPNIRNYSDVAAPHLGGRLEADYRKDFGRLSVDWITGVEVQSGASHSTVSENNGGTKGALLSEAKLINTSAILFTQITGGWRGWSLSGGLSYNDLHIRYSPLAPQELAAQTLSYTPLAPRFSARYKPVAHVSIFAAAAYGFSPPTIDELAPTGSAANLALQPEQGWSYDAGIRTELLKSRLFIDLTAFRFALQQAIVERRDSAGGDYYLNAGGTLQQGLELAVNYRLAAKKTFSCNAYLSYTLSDFRYRDFTKLGIDYSGNRLPGTSPGALALGVDGRFASHWSLSINYLYRDAQPLNDAGSALLAAYQILSAKAGYEVMCARYSWMIFAGGDNLLNAHYSLGPDINAAAGRYFNAAPPVNFFAGLRVSYRG